MKKDKTFDCVEMKWEIQERHRREVDAHGKEEAERRRWQRVLDDPVLGAFVRANPAKSRGGARESSEKVAG